MFKINDSHGRYVLMASGPRHRRRTRVPLVGIEIECLHHKEVDRRCPRARGLRPSPGAVVAPHDMKVRARHGRGQYAGLSEQMDIFSAQPHHLATPQAHPCHEQVASRPARAQQRHGLAVTGPINHGRGFGQSMTCRQPIHHAAVDGADDRTSERLADGKPYGRLAAQRGSARRRRRVPARAGTAGACGTSTNPCGKATPRRSACWRRAPESTALRSRRSWRALLP